MHRLHPAGQVAAFDDPRQRAQHVGFVAEVHGAVRPLPVAQHAEALEPLALAVDLLQRVLAALGAEPGGIQLLTDLAMLFLHRDLDRQAVAVPAGHVRRVEARQVLRAHHHVLEDLVDCVADVDVAIGVGRSVVQHEDRAPYSLRAQLRVQARLAPARQGLRLTPGEVPAHREIRGRQLQCRFVVLGHAVARKGCSERMRRACAASRCICTVIAARSPKRCSSRSLATNSTSRCWP